MNPNIIITPSTRRQRQISMAMTVVAAQEDNFIEFHGRDDKTQIVTATSLTHRRQIAQEARTRILSKRSVPLKQITVGERFKRVVDSISFYNIYEVTDQRAMTTTCKTSNGNTFQFASDIRAVPYKQGMIIGKVGRPRKEPNAYK